MPRAGSALYVCAVAVVVLAVSSFATASDETRSGPIGDVWAEYGDRYAIIVMGGDTTNVKPTLYRYYWLDTSGMYSELIDRGFEDDNIYFLSWGDSADAHPAIVDTISNEANIEDAYDWAELVCTADDLLYIFWVDHGWVDTTSLQSYFRAHDNWIRDDELATMTHAVNAKQIIGAYNPCFSGGFVDDLSASNVITATSQDTLHPNCWGWAGAWRTALRGGTGADPSDTNGDGHVSMTEAYLWVAPKAALTHPECFDTDDPQPTPEHSKFDDNGDGVAAEVDSFGYSPGLDVTDPTKDGYKGRMYSLNGYIDASIIHDDGTGDYANIQAAIDASSSYDAIVLIEGTYQGTGNRGINYGGKSIVVQSISLDPSDTVIDCQYADRGFEFWSGEDSLAILEGVTIKNGDPGYLLGGGMHCNNSSSPVISNCWFIDNRAPWYGGGASSSGGSSPGFVDCVFDGNYVQNTFGQGGGFWGEEGTDAEFIRCTFYGNNADDGSGVCLKDSSYASIDRTVIAAGISGEAVSCTATSVPSLTCCDIYGNAGGDWSNDIAGQLGTSNNITVDPLFCDGPGGDFTLCSDSACAPTYSPCSMQIGAFGPGCSACSATATVTGHPSGDEVCAGDPVTFTVSATGTAPLSYQWRKGGSPIGGATSASYSIPSAVTGDAGSYDVVVTNYYGSATSSAAVLVVDATPVVTDHPDNVAPCEGGSTAFDVVASGETATAPLSYQWRKNGANISGATGSSYSISPVGTGHAGNYDVIVTNVCGSDTSNAATLTVHTAADITDHPDSQTILEGQPVTFTVIASSPLSLTYQWRKDDFDIEGQTGTTLYIASVTGDDAGDYDVRITNICATVISDAATLTVTTAPEVTTHPVGQAVCPTHPVTLTSAATGTPPLEYQWRKDSVDITGAESSSYGIASFGSGDVGDYDIVVTNDWGADTSDVATLSMGGPPVITQHPYGNEVCVGRVLGLRVIADASPPATYLWYKDGSPLSDGGRITGSTTDSLNIDPAQMSDQGDYDVAVANACSTVSSLAANIIMRPTLLRVPSDCPTIQAAIDSVCPDGGVVVLRDSTWTVPDTIGYEFGGRNITVRSEGGDPALCTIDCQNSGRAFIFRGGEPSTAKLKDIGIINGNVSGNGGGILCTAYSNPTIENCDFFGNSATGSGGGIASITSVPDIVSCVFDSNSAGGMGGGVYEANAAAGISGCTFWRNSAGSAGGGVFGHACDDALITSSTFHGNTAPTGGGLCVGTGTYAQVENCLFTANNLNAVACISSGSATLQCCDVFMNAGGDWVGCISLQAPPANQNIFADPLYCGAGTGDFTLASTSPCLNAPGCGQIGAWGMGCSAGSSSWIAGVGNWVDNPNWSDGIPGPGCVADISNGGTAQINLPGAACQELWLPNVAGGEGHLEVSAGDLTTDLLKLGSEGLGSVSQSGGTVEITPDMAVDNLLIGELGGGTAKYDISGGDLTATYVHLGANAAAGTLAVSGTANVTVDAIWMNQDGGNATLDIAGGSVEASLGVDVSEFGFGSVDVQGTGQLTAGSVNIRANSGTNYLRVYDGGAMYVTQLLVEVHLSGYATADIEGISSLGLAIIRGSGTGEALLDLGPAGSFTGDLELGGAGQTGRYRQTGGVADVGTATIAMLGDGFLDLTGGSLTVTDMNVGFHTGISDGGELMVSDPGAWFEVENSLVVYNTGRLFAAPGTDVHMTGPAARFENMSMDHWAVEGLGGMRFIFEGGVSDVATMEVCCEDRGAEEIGYDENFTVGCLALGGGDLGQVRLQDAHDNQPGVEALYVDHLEVGAFCYLDLNGLNLYYRTADIDIDAIIDLNGGTLAQVGGTSVPESRFTAAPTESGSVMLRWEVESLEGIEGFAVWRAERAEGPFERVNEHTLEPAARCEYEDADVWPDTEFWYEVRTRMSDGTTDVLGDAPLVVRTGGTLRAVLYPPRPNPFDNTTSLTFDVPDHEGDARLVIYSIAGRLVRRLAGDAIVRGRHTVEWDGTDEHGRRVSHGVYFARLEVGSELRRQKVVLLK